MKSKLLWLSCLLTAAVAMATAGCGDETTNDLEKPKIWDDSLPVNCQEVRRGDVLQARFTFTDNVELGSYNIEVHNNFDHHSHSTSATECEQEADKEPVRPWVYNKDFAIGEGLKAFVAEMEIEVPADVDAGDYHFMVRVTDQSGWQEIKSVSIRVL